MAIYRRLLRTSGALFFIALGCSVMGGLSNAALLALINQGLNASDAQRLQLAWQFALLALLMLGTRTLSQSLFMAMGQRSKAELRRQLVQQVADAGYANLEKHGMPRALSILTQDLDQVVVFFISLPGFVMSLAVITGCIAYLGYLSLTVMVIALITILIGSLGYSSVHRRALQLMRQSRQREEALTGEVSALFSGAKELRLHAPRKHAFMHNKLFHTIEQVRVERTRGYVLYALANIWASVFFFAFIGAVMFLLARVLDLQGSVMSGFAMVFLYMIVPIENALSALPGLTLTQVALKRIAAMQQQLPPEHTAFDKPPQSFQRLELRALTYQHDVFQLGPISLQFQPGELVYLTGGNGSGKTTLARLITGLYQAESGTLLLDDVAIDEKNRAGYRQLFSTVFNDFHLFDDLQGIDNAHLDNDVQRLLRSLQLEKKVTLENGTFSTLALSTGQRKRLALLVAWLEDRPFYLFDEWAADQDPAFREVFYHQLLPALKARGKTVLVITHDDRYFHLADRCLKLEWGQLVSA
ncbi:cyclic peptide export ABC transporter [Pantoea sp. NPDC088449]|uniref:cyclic peptide export ABC transporter n=1 Tax=Pantoea sp. NPDC088449 TaxID=3364392 RepID=UPI003828F6E6